MTNYDDDALRRITTALRAERRKAGLRARHMHARLEPLYRLSFSSYRGLEQLSRNGGAPRFNQPLVDALARALGIPRDRLASDADYATLPALPYRAAQQQGIDRDLLKTPPRYIDDPDTVMQRVRAFAEQRGCAEPRSLARSLTLRGYKISESTLRRKFREPDAVSEAFIDAMAAVLTHASYPIKPFDRNRLLVCDGLCPHCKPWLVSA